MNKAAPKTFLQYGLIPAVFIIVALSQVSLSLTTGLTPWKGGGFGMFSSSDNGKMRFITAVATDEDGFRSKILLDSAMPYLGPILYSRSKNFPSEPRLREIGKRLLQEQFIFTDRGNESPFMLKVMRDNRGKDFRELREYAALLTYELMPKPIPDDLSYPLVRLQEVELQVWRLRFDAGKDRVWSERLGEPVIVRKS